MGNRDGTRQEPGRFYRPPAETSEGREKQLIAKAMNAVEKRIEQGEASAQELVYFLKVGSRREQLERQKIEYENQLLQTKNDAIASQSRMEDLIADAIKAMSMYSGRDVSDDRDA